ncbi:hypothetical protein C8Q74DRAFT_1221625 [Fomes fomentarius]|nr:hypothetical protein C8Q74DRAFT_1221625 [Fomes fomentarius]
MALLRQYSYTLRASPWHAIDMDTPQPTFSARPDTVDYDIGYKINKYQHTTVVEFSRHTTLVRQILNAGLVRTPMPNKLREMTEENGIQGQRMIPHLHVATLNPDGSLVRTPMPPWWDFDMDMVRLRFSGALPTLYSADILDIGRLTDLYAGRMDDIRTRLVPTRSTWYFTIVDGPNHALTSSGLPVTEASWTHVSNAVVAVYTKGCAVDDMTGFTTPDLGRQECSTYTARTLLTGTWTMSTNKNMRALMTRGLGNESAG